MDLMDKIAQHFGCQYIYLRAKPDVTIKTKLQDFPSVYCSLTLTDTEKELIKNLYNIDMKLESTNGNTGLIKAYRDLGFTLVDPRSKYNYDNAWTSGYLMYKKVPDLTGSAGASGSGSVPDLTKDEQEELAQKGEGKARAQLAGANRMPIKWEKFGEKWQVLKGTDSRQKIGELRTLRDKYEFKGYKEANTKDEIVNLLNDNGVFIGVPPQARSGISPTMSSVFGP